MKKINLENSKSFLFIDKILKFFLKKGKLKTAETNLENLIKFLLISKDLTRYSIFLKIYKYLYISFEIRNIKIRRNSYFIPIAVKKKRRLFLITKFLFDAALKDKSLNSISTKLNNEIVKYVDKAYENSESFVKKESIKKDILKFRSNSHFRWY
jgi:ribosomal protein S7